MECPGNELVQYLEGHVNLTSFPQYNRETSLAVGPVLDQIVADRTKLFGFLNGRRLYA